jgi:hypothetical protein
LTNASHTRISVCSSNVEKLLTLSTFDIGDWFERCANPHFRQLSGSFAFGPAVASLSLDVHKSGQSQRARWIRNQQSSAGASGRIGREVAKRLAKDGLSVAVHYAGNRAKAVERSPHYLVNSTGLVAIDLGSLAVGGAMHEVGAPLSGMEFHFVRRLR